MRPRSRPRRRRRRRVRHGIDGEQDIDNCVIFFREDIDHQGLAKSIDREYAMEKDKLGLSFWDVLEREQERKPEDISEKSRGMSAWARAKRRMTYARGDTESKYALMADRTYGAPELLDQDHLREAPSLDDLNQRPAKFKETYWITPVFRLGVIAASYLAFPLFLEVFHNFETIDAKQFDIVVGQIAPKVGVLYATILALTLQVLYQRFTRIQENVTTEAMLLSQVARNFLSLFANEEEWAIEACQMIANQVRIMLSRTRGVELLSIMKADTYASLLSIINDYHYLHGCDADYTPQEESITSMLRVEIGQLMETRALRLADEASSLPSTHFTLITSLSFVSIVAYVTASLKVVDDLMHPPQEASLLFAGLLALYILFFNFCRDLNGPFEGVYQIKRSNAVSHLMQTKWLIMNQLGDSVSFNVNYGEDEEQLEVEDSIKAFFSGPETEDIATVEANTMQTLVDELESAVETIGQEDDLHEAALPATASLDYLEDGSERRLLQMKDELARLKLLSQQLSHGEVSTGRPDPEGRLRRMEEELDRLKQLNQQITHGVQVSTGHINHKATVHIGAPTVEVDKDLRVAKSALQMASLKTAVTEKALAKATRANVQSTSLIESKSKLLTDKATGAAFDPKLDDLGLFLVGVGVRKKAIIKVYNVGMYCSLSALEAVSPLSRGKDAQTALRNAARTFNSSSPTTSFVLNMVFKAGAQTIAGAISDSVKPRYGGPVADVKELEALISEGVKSKGGQATKGTVFRFDCSGEGVSVSVDGRMQGMAHFEGMGSAFVDVFMDDKAVSPQLVNSCLDTWCESDIHQKKEKAKERVHALTKQVDEARSKEEKSRKGINELEAKQKEERKKTEKEFALQTTLDEAMTSDEALLGQAEETFKEELIKMAEEENRRRAEEAA